LPEVGNIWEIINSHQDLPPLIEPGDPPDAAANKAYQLSLSPTYGINACYVGGQTGSVYQGFVPTKAPPGLNDYAPNVGRHVVFSASEVRHASDLIVFADCKLYQAPGQTASSTGMHFLSPPLARGQNWEVVNGKIKRIKDSTVLGIPEGWYSDRIMTAFFDGHVEAMRPQELRDMRHWANWADDENYDFTPL
jgi:prepilin-type processing-associated H-X9-DG protein